MNAQQPHTILGYELRSYIICHLANLGNV